MRIAFYAPLKPVDHPVPSGDRLMARLLVDALKMSGYEVDISARLRSRVADGNGVRQVRLAELGGKLAARLLRRYQSGFLLRPDIWFTYHLYYKAPDWIGPLVARKLGIPYVIAEASHAPKRATGPWAASHHAIEQTLKQADAIISLNRADMACLEQVCSLAKLHFVPPFIPVADWAGPRFVGDESGPVRLVTVAMMRGGDKLASYRVLANALQRLPQDRRWSLTIIGDGPARSDVERLFAGFTAGQIHFAGQCDRTTTRRWLWQSDAFVWPAVNEAYGMAILEAQAAGLPVIAGDSGGVSGIVVNGVTGWLVPVGDVPALSSRLASILADRALLRATGQKAERKAAHDHDIAGASQKISSILQKLGEIA
ncbi:glycosyltransferase family 4 protein [Thalassospira sp.]|uniref:glycosyltransferase family 4 protein n=1 Tax=Thalassospira sp. TaxID=1912094 RepID=UPI002736C211|nr:glycosyltransferase family 4 protein [Thalassospira sp.]MDP2698108.1 glycosyltransferase family 4 protein [Thalassospira sp.]